MSGTSGSIFDGGGCSTFLELETFVATAGQTTFTLMNDVVGDVHFSRNGSTLPDDAATVVGNVVTYVPTSNGGNPLLVNDRIEIAYTWEDCTGVLGGGGPAEPIPNDLLTALAGVAALTDADRGLSLGEVDIPTNRALTVAEMTQLNAMNVGIPMGDMQSIYTNKAVEAGAPGVMNTNGQLGYAFRYLPASSAATAVTALANAVDNNGVYSLLTLVNGDVITVPAPRYSGQILTIRIGTVAPTDEVTLVFPSQPFLGGVYRKPDGKIEHGMAGNITLKARTGESIYLIARSAANGWDVTSHNTRSFFGAGYAEQENGTYTLSLTASAAGVATFPAGVSPALNTTYNIGRNPAGITKGLTSVSGLAAGEEIQITNYVRA